MKKRNLLAYGLISICLLLCSKSTLAQTEFISQKEAESYLKKSIGTIRFAQNKGQLPETVLFAGTSAVGSFYFERNQLVFKSVILSKDSNKIVKNGTHNWAIKFENGNTNPKVEFKNIQSTKVNYISNGSNVMDVSVYNEVYIKEIYPGISLRLYSQNNKTLEFDWIVDSKADFNLIKMKFIGHENLFLNKNGDLLTALHNEEINFNDPVSFQVIDNIKVELNIDYKIDNDLVYFETKEEINPDFPLIIDPELRWGTLFDNNSTFLSWDGYLLSADVDPSLNVYVAGWFDSDFGATYVPGRFGYDSTYTSGQQDGLVIKFNPLATEVLKITFYGGSSGFDRFHAIDVSDDGTRVFLAGATTSALPSGSLTTSFDNTLDGGEDGLVLVMDNNLTNILYSTLIGGPGSNFERISTIRSLSNTSFVIGGIISDALPSNYILKPADSVTSNDEIYVAKFNSLNTLVFGTYCGGNSWEQFNDLEIASNGDVVFVGATDGTAGFPTLVNGVSSQTNIGIYDGLIAVVPANGGHFKMLSRVGGQQEDEIMGLCIGKNDTLFCSGRTTAYSSTSTFPLGTGASAANRFDIVYHSPFQPDGFVIKTPITGNSTGTDPYMATLFGGNGTDRGNCIANFKNRAVMIFGSTGSTDFPVKNTWFTGNFYDSTYNGVADMVFLGLDYDLKSNYFATYAGGSGEDYMGEGGAPMGSNHFMIIGDSIGLVATTTHSSSFTPKLLGNKYGTTPVWDTTHAAGGDDSYMIFEWLLEAPQPFIPETFGKIGNYIWLDADKDGQQDAGEAGLADVVVELFKDYNNDGDLNDASENIPY